MTIVRDEDVLGGEPRIEGTRVGVRHVAADVVEGGRSPAYVADQLGLSLASGYEAHSCYANLDEIREAERGNEAAFERVSERSRKPKEPVE